LNEEQIDYVVEKIKCGITNAGKNSI